MQDRERFRPRSLLYVPPEPRRLAKLPAIDADLFVIDLEDGVAPANKERAREEVSRWFAAGSAGADRCWIRINASRSRWHVADLELVDAIDPAGVVLAKAENETDVRRLRQLRPPRKGLGLMIETPRGVAAARDLARHADLLVLGSADLRLASGATEDEARSWERHAMAELLLAARVHGAAAIDSVFFRYLDAAGLERHARIARALGFDGKSCIHPDQIAVVHRVWASTDTEVAWAERVVEAWEAAGPDRAVTVVDGEMIEALHVTLARRILDRR